MSCVVSGVVIFQEPSLWPYGPLRGRFFRGFNCVSFWKPLHSGYPLLSEFLSNLKVMVLHNGENEYGFVTLSVANNARGDVFHSESLL